MNFKKNLENTLHANPKFTWIAKFGNCFIEMKINRTNRYFRHPIVTIRIPKLHFKTRNVLIKLHFVYEIKLKTMTDVVVYDLCGDRTKFSSQVTPKNIFYFFIFVQWTHRCFISQIQIAHSNCYNFKLPKASIPSD